MNIPIQLSHSNGFGFKTYNHFMSFLKPYKVQGVELIGHHPDYPITKNYDASIQELIKNIEASPYDKVIGIGHSLGATLTIFAAQQRPDLFERIILIDPALFRFNKRLLINTIKTFGNIDKFGPSKRAIVRKQYFSDKEEAYTYFKGKRLFKNFDENCFNDYIEHGLKNSKEGGVELTFSRDTEAAVFREMPLFVGNGIFKMPSTLLYSGQYDLLEKRDIRWLRRKFRRTKFIPVDGGHLFPLEKPAETADLIKSIIENNL